MKTLHFKCITPIGTTFEDDVEQVSLTTTLGEITILPDHIPMVAMLEPGEAVVKKGSSLTPMVVHGGMVEILPGNEVHVLADAAEHVDSMDAAEVEAAVTAAKALKDETFNTADFEDAALSLEREQARIRVMRKYRAKGFRSGKPEN